MQNSNVPTLRRSSRVPIAVPILVTSLDPGANFSEVCETLVVSAHGCAMRAPVKLETGVPLHFHSQEGRETTAKVVYCQPIKSDRLSWRLGARFDRPENFWGLQTCPKDWAKLPATVERNGDPMLSSTHILPPNPATASAKIVLDRIKKQLSDEHLKEMLAELVRPLAAEVTDLKEKLAQGTKRSRFEVSLSQIPPELEQQLELRLKKELGPQVLKQAQEQSEQILEAAKAAINQKTTETHGEFVRRVTLDLQGVEQRAQGLSTNVAQTLREHLNRGQGELHQQVIDAGTRVKRLSDDLLRVMEKSLGEIHDARRRELEQVQATVAAESSRLQEQVSDLDGRMAKLDESAHRLESGLDKRLSQMSSDIVRSARSQLESALEIVLAELGTRNAQELGSQLHEARVNLQTIQKEIEASVSDTLRIQVAETLQSFEHSIEELAQQSVERWRLALAGGLNSLAKTLGEQFVLRAAADSSAGQHSPVE
ncbi:MAG: hypothetical protein WB660_18585 [Candidatus Sulfotelmatobacter sp.]